MDRWQWNQLMEKAGVFLHILAPCTTLHHIYPLGDPMIMKAVRVLRRDWTDQYRSMAMDPTRSNWKWHTRPCQEWKRARYWWIFVPGTCQVLARWSWSKKQKGFEKDWRPSESQATILRYPQISRCLKNLCELHWIAYNCQYVLGSHQAVQMQPA